MLSTNEQPFCTEKTVDFNMIDRLCECCANVAQWVTNARARSTHRCEPDPGLQVDTIFGASGF